VPLAEDRLRLPAGLPPAVDCAVADVDGDGLADILRASEAGVHVLLQRAGGSFALHPTQPLLAYPGRAVRSVAVGRFQPARPSRDLVVAFQSGPAEVLWQTGSGVFAPAPVPLPPPIAPVARVVVFDHDRTLPEDLLVVPEQGRPQILLGQLDGSHRDASWLFDPNLVLQAPRMAFADVDADGDRDLVVASPLLAAPFSLENGPTGYRQQRTLPVRGGCSALAVADLDRDGREDVVFARASPLPAGL
jgi:hypothetical protein